MKKETANPWTLLTSGPTRAYLDSVRYIANSSTGALGSRIAESLLSVDIGVIHLKGIGSEPVSIKPGSKYVCYDVDTIDSLIGSIYEIHKIFMVGAVIHSMAVLDYIPENVFKGKKSSSPKYWDIRLVKTPKVSGIIRGLFPDAYMAGFKLETNSNDEKLALKAYQSLKKHGLDVVIANDIHKVNNQNHEAIFVGKDGSIFHKAFTKEEIADEIKSLLTKNVYKG